tara:strand:- start:13024 stop:14652 length:1629 start_codon:yes stop_codon:yes gene_type:complete
MSGQSYQIGDYNQTYKTFRQSIPEIYNWAYDVFDKWGKDQRKTAIVWVSSDGKESREVSFHYMTHRSIRLANALSGLGAIPGDRIFTLLPRVVEWWEIMLGCMRARLVPVPGTTLLTSKDIEYRINASESKIAITDIENIDKIESIRQDCPSLEKIIVVGDHGPWFEYENLIRDASDKLPHPRNLSSDPLVIYFTSGTTGHPKMVLNTHSTYPLGHLVTGKFWLDNRPTDLHWTLADTGWAQAAWTHFFAPWTMGASIFVWDHRDKFDAKGTLRMFEKFPITTFFAPPTAYRMMVQENLSAFKPTKLRHLVGAGEALNPEVIQEWRNHTNLHIWEGYGQTETTLIAATFPGMQYRPGSMGVTAPGYYMAIVDEQGNELPTGQEGEIAIKTYPEWPVGLFPEYWRNPEANAKSFRNNWYYTGDLATQDTDGYFWFIGRTDDVIISSSYRIGPFEVESALVEHESVAEAAVIGKPDPLRNEIVKAFVVLAEGQQPSNNLVTSLQDHVKKTTAPYKYPREIEFVKELPKTVSGKIQRNQLRDAEI